MSSGLNEQGQPYPELVDEQVCTTCGLCFRMCPDAAIEVTEEEKSKVKR
jgi:NAD-dependent dihydropyrimidine dehydrogenase PreA subunit